MKSSIVMLSLMLPGTMCAALDGLASQPAMVVALVEKEGQPGAAQTVHREMPIQHRYLHLPVRTGVAKKRMKLSVDGRTIRDFEIELAGKEPEFWVFVDLDGFNDKTLRIEV